MATKAAWGRAARDRGASVKDSAPLPAHEQLHNDDRAVFEAIRSELVERMAQVKKRLDLRSPNGRRLALLYTKLEEAEMQAKQGAHEAHYGQG